MELGRRGTIGSTASRLGDLSLLVLSGQCTENNVALLIAIVLASVGLQIRRVVTGHNQTGRALAKIDEIAKNVISNRPGALSCVIWSTDRFPVDNDGDGDPSTRKIRLTIDNGTVFRIVRFEPGISPRCHRTDSIDYAVVMSGEIEMELDDQVVRLRAGDVLVQRGTIHNWVNRGREPCVIAFVLGSAKPVTAGGKTLAVQG